MVKIDLDGKYVYPSDFHDVKTDMLYYSKIIYVNHINIGTLSNI